MADTYCVVCVAEASLELDFNSTPTEKFERHVYNHDHVVSYKGYSLCRRHLREHYQDLDAIDYIIEKIDLEEPDPIALEGCGGGAGSWEAGRVDYTPGRGEPAYTDSIHVRR